MLVRRRAARKLQIRNLESFPINSTSIELDKQGVYAWSERPASRAPLKDADALSNFIVAYWEKNKSVPNLREMCEALNYSTRQAVSALLHKMRGGSPLVVKRKKNNVGIVVIGDAEAWRDAWKYRNYLRYRSLKLTRNFIACYHYRKRAS
jgi:hypothetical protein